MSKFFCVDYFVRQFGCPSDMFLFFVSTKAGLRASVALDIFKAGVYLGKRGVVLTH